MNFTLVRRNPGDRPLIGPYNLPIRWTPFWDWPLQGHINCPLGGRLFGDRPLLGPYKLLIRWALFW